MQGDQFVLRDEDSTQYMKLYASNKFDSTLKNNAMNIDCRIKSQQKL